LSGEEVREDVSLDADATELTDPAAAGASETVRDGGSIVMVRVLRWWITWSRTIGAGTAV